MKIDLLIIDDEPEFANSLRRSIRRSSLTDNINIKVAIGGSSGLTMIENFHPEIIVTDMRMPEINGSDIIEYAKNHLKDIYIVVMTGFADIKQVISLLKTGVYDYIPKPFEFKEFEAIILRIISEKQIKKSLFESEEMFRQLAENIPEVFFLFNLKSERFIYVSPSFEKIIGHPIKLIDESPVSLLDYINRTEQKLKISDIKSSLSKGNIFEEEVRITTADRMMKWFLIKIIPLFNTKNDIYRYAGTASDITERRRIAHELEKAGKLEIEIGAQIQRAVLFAAPLTEQRGALIEAMTIPSKQIDGDFYDFHVYNDEMIDIIIGDVMGKGIHAALIAAAMKNTFLQSKADLLIQQTKGIVPEPDDILNLANSLISSKLIDLSSFITLNYARFNFYESKLDFIDCGNTPILYFSCKTNSCWKLKGSNFPIGFTDDEIYNQFSMPFESDDLFIFYSDGISESSNPDGEYFGENRLIQIIRQNCTYSPSEILDRILSSVTEFSKTDKFKDDLTCIAIKIKNAPTPQIPFFIRENSLVSQINYRRCGGLFRK